MFWACAEIIIFYDIYYSKVCFLLFFGDQTYNSFLRLHILLVLFNKIHLELSKLDVRYYNMCFKIMMRIKIITSHIRFSQNQFF